MNKTLIAGLVLVVGSILLAKGAYEDFYVYRHGRIVKMQIVQLPSSCPSARTRYEIKFDYKGDIYQKMTRGAYCENHRIGEFVNLKMVNGINKILLPKEPGYIDIIACFTMGLFGIIVAISSVRKSK